MSRTPKVVKGTGTPGTLGHPTLGKLNPSLKGNPQKAVLPTPRTVTGRLGPTAAHAAASNAPGVIKATATGSNKPSTPVKVVPTQAVIDTLLEEAANPNT